MPTYPFYQVDAFTNEPLGGNPCAVVFDADDLDAATMQAVAREMNLSETAFVRRSEIADVAARYFTPSEEIPMAGHPTIATVFILAQTGRLALSGERTTITLELQVGPIPVAVEHDDGRIERVVMTQKTPQFLDTFAAADVLPLFGLTAQDALPDMPFQVVSTGTPQLMIPLRNHDALRRALVNLADYPAFRRDAGFFSAHLFCLRGATPNGRTFARHFGTPPDVFEDPFTGSATGGMAAYLWRYHLLDEPHFIAEQGHWMHRPGQAFVEVVGPRDAIACVRVGGAAVTVLRGELHL